MKRVALFGGTFDPAHAGHLEVARLARTHLALEAVYFIPCLLSPHKQGGPLPTSGLIRLQMLELALRRYSWARVDDRELGREGVSFSWQTAEEFSIADPSAKLYWIMGADQWQALPRWARPERLAEIVEFLVFTRGDQVLEGRPGYRSRFLEIRHPASSSEIRNAMAERRRVPDDWLDPGVESLIRANGLYGVPNAPS